MKKVFLMASIGLLVTGCEKEWNCTTTTNTTYLGSEISSTSSQTFHGSADEAEAFEEQNTKSEPGLSAVTHCN